MLLHLIVLQLVISIKVRILLVVPFFTLSMLKLFYLVPAAFLALGVFLSTVQVHIAFLEHSSTIVHSFVTLRVAPRFKATISSQCILAHALGIFDILVSEIVLKTLIATLIEFTELLLRLSHFAFWTLIVNFRREHVLSGTQQWVVSISVGRLLIVPLLACAITK